VHEALIKVEVAVEVVEAVEEIKAIKAAIVAGENIEAV
jgi:hypothetical protein